MLRPDGHGLLEQGDCRIDGHCLSWQALGSAPAILKSAYVVDVDVKLCTSISFSQTFVRAVQDPHEHRAEGLYI